MIDKDDFKKLVKSRGRSWNDKLWDLLCDEYAEYVETPEAFMDAEEELLESYITHQDISRQKKPKQTTAAREIQPNKRTETVGKILAIEARRRSDLRGFREDYLKSKPLLNINAAAKWIRAKAKKEGLPEGWSVRIFNTGTGLPFPTLHPPPDTMSLRKRTTHSRPDVLEFLEFDDKNGIIFSSWVPIRHDGILGILKCLVDELTYCYPAWAEDQTATFALTDIAPKLSRGRITLQNSGSFTPASRIEMTLDPRLSASEVATMYEQIKQTLQLPSRDKPMFDKHLELAVFAAEHCRGEDSLSWPDLKELWNKQVSAEHADWKYESESFDTTWNFCRDVRVAWERVTGLVLEKPTAKGGSKK